MLGDLEKSPSWRLDIGQGVLGLSLGSVGSIPFHLAGLFVF